MEDPSRGGTRERSVLERLIEEEEFSPQVH